MFQHQRLTELIRMLLSGCQVRVNDCQGRDRDQVWIDRCVRSIASIINFLLRFVQILVQEGRDRISCSSGAGPDQSRIIRRLLSIRDDFPAAPASLTAATAAHLQQVCNDLVCIHVRKVLHGFDLLLLLITQAVG